LSVVILLIGADGATAHYLRWSWGDRTHPIGWLLGMLFLLPSQHEVAVSRFLKHVVPAPRSASPRRDEFNRIKGISDASYDTFICQMDAFSIIHLLLYDYDYEKILSFCAGLPSSAVMTEYDVWNANKKAILSYVSSGKDLKLIWERSLTCIITPAAA
jgi:hypothetical protein